MSAIIHEITTEAELEPVRIYDYCLGKFPQLPTRKSLKKALDQGRIHVNGESVGTGFWLKGHEKIQLYEDERTPPKTYRLDLEVVYEDEHLAAVIKPAGLLTNGNTFKTLEHALPFNLKQSEEKDVLNWPKPVHRLDRATSGIVLIAKTKSSRARLGQQFEAKQISKVYHAVVLGKVLSNGTIDDPIDGKSAQTEYEVLNTVHSLRSTHLSLLRLKPLTGRTHQLRIHLSEIGHAILGDPIYSPKELYLRSKGLFLCATHISFHHPIHKRGINLEIKPPKKFKSRMKNEERRWVNQKLT